MFKRYCRYSVNIVILEVTGYFNGGVEGVTRVRNSLTNGKFSIKMDNLSDFLYFLNSQNVFKD